MDIGSWFMDSSDGGARHWGSGCAYRVHRFLELGKNVRHIEEDGIELAEALPKFMHEGTSVGEG
jgi:hypothetical protein